MSDSKVVNVTSVLHKLYSTNHFLVSKTENLNIIHKNIFKKIPSRFSSQLTTRSRTIAKQTQNLNSNRTHGYNKSQSLSGPSFCSTKNVTAGERMGQRSPLNVSHFRILRISQTIFCFLRQGQLMEFPATCVLGECIFINSTDWSIGRRREEG